MGAARKYAVIDPATGKLDRSLFSEQSIYDEEMEKIFASPDRGMRRRRCTGPRIASVGVFVRP